VVGLTGAAHSILPTSIVAFENHPSTQPAAASVGGGTVLASSRSLPVSAAMNAAIESLVTCHPAGSRVNRPAASSHAGTSTTQGDADAGRFAASGQPVESEASLAVIPIASIARRWETAASKPAAASIRRIESTVAPPPTTIAIFPLRHVAASDRRSCCQSARARRLPPNLTTVVG
jgi:hypothetical protein